MIAMDAILYPAAIHSRHEVLDGDCVPSSPVSMPWYSQRPSGLPTDECHSHKGLTLLYIGIAPKSPPRWTPPKFPNPPRPSPESHERQRRGFHAALRDSGVFACQGAEP